MENMSLHRQIIAAGQQAGLFLDDEQRRGEHKVEAENNWALTEPVVFTLRPVEEYLRHYRGSWTRMKVEPVAVGEWGDDELGEALIFETHFRLAYSDGDSSDAPGLVIEDMVARIVDFTESYPAEAARLFVIPFGLEMAIQGEIIYQPGEDEWPMLDFGMYSKLSVHVEVYGTATETGFEQALATLSDDSPMTGAIQQALQHLALFFRWMDTEMPSRPPLLDLLDL